MEAILLAGGLGTRLKSVVANSPKPMAMINDKPFLTYILEYLLKQGVTHAVMAVGYKWEMIRDYYGDPYSGIKIDYSVENEPLGTGGAIKQAFRMCQEDIVFIINGDTYFDVDLLQMNNYKIEKNADLVIATKHMRNFDRYGTITIESSQIVSFEEKKPLDNGLINGGIYLCQKKCLDSISEVKFSFEKDFLEKYLRTLKMCSFESEGYFIDIGIPEDYSKFVREAKNVK